MEIKWHKSPYYIRLGLVLKRRTVRSNDFTQMLLYQSSDPLTSVLFRVKLDNLGMIFS